MKLFPNWYLSRVQCLAFRLQGYLIHTGWQSVYRNHAVAFALMYSIGTYQHLVYASHSWHTHFRVGYGTIAVCFNPDGISPFHLSTIVSAMFGIAEQYSSGRITNFDTLFMMFCAKVMFISENSKWHGKVRFIPWKIIRW